MNHQVKTMLVDALMKVVDNAPTKSVSYSQDIPRANFKVWIDYIYSILKIFADDLNPRDYVMICNDIQNIVNAPHNSNSQMILRDKTLKICQLLLNFARRVLYM